MIKPKINEKWFVDLSPAVGAELGGVRRCLVDKIINDKLIRVVPYSLFGDVPMYNYARTVDILRLKERCL